MATRTLNDTNELVHRGSPTGSEIATEVLHDDIASWTARIARPSTVEFVAAATRAGRKDGCSMPLPRAVKPRSSWRSVNTL